MNELHSHRRRAKTLTYLCRALGRAGLSRLSQASALWKQESHVPTPRPALPRQGTLECVWGG